MDTSIKTPDSTPERKIIGWRCTADGKYFAEFENKRCRYCLPIYESEFDGLKIAEATERG